MSEEKATKANMVFQTVEGNGQNAHPVAMIQMVKATGANGEEVPVVMSVVVGGYDKVLDMARLLMPSLLRRMDEVQGMATGEIPYHGWNVEEAAEIALAAAQCLRDKYELRKKITESRLPRQIITP